MGLSGEGRGLGEEGAELRSCVKVLVAVPGSSSLISLMVSVDVKHHVYLEAYRDQELCESPGDRPGLPVPNKPHAFCGRKATLNQSMGGGGGEH